jgi:hypothetical protein
MNPYSHSGYYVFQQPCSQERNSKYLSFMKCYSLWAMRENCCVLQHLNSFTTSETCSNWTFIYMSLWDRDCEMVNVHHTLVASPAQSTTHASESTRSQEQKFLRDEMGATWMFLSPLTKFHIFAQVITCIQNELSYFKSSFLITW